MIQADGLFPFCIPFDFAKLMVYKGIQVIEDRLYHRWRLEPREDRDCTAKGAEGRLVSSIRAGFGNLPSLSLDSQVLSVLTGGGVVWLIFDWPGRFWCVPFQAIFLAADRQGRLTA